MLTFDDGPSAWTPDVLEVLRDADVPATFFAVGERIRANPHVTAYQVREGHQVLNHTDGHERLTDLSDPQLRRTVTVAGAALADVGAGASALLRPPYAASDARTDAVVAAMGVRLVRWTASTVDWHPDVTAQQVRSNAAAGLRDGAILLLHDGPMDTPAGEATVGALPGIIHDARSAGLCFGQLDELGRPTPARLGPDQAEGPPRLVAEVPYRPLTYGHGRTVRQPDLRDVPSSLRVAGASRYETAAAVARESFPRADLAVLATGDDFPDALTGATHAGRLDAPLLLVERDDVPAVTLDALRDLGVQRAVVVGGASAVSSAVIDALAEVVTDVERVAGDTRWATAAAVAARGPAASTAYVVSGEGFADAVSATVNAIVDDAPMLLTARDRVPRDTLRALRDLGVDRVVVVGGTSAVSDQVARVLATRTRSGDVVRHAGATRYATAASLPSPGNGTAVLVATGTAFADALGGGVAAARLEARVLLVPPRGPVPAEVAAVLRRERPTQVRVLGGTGAVAAHVEAELRARASATE